MRALSLAFLFSLSWHGVLAPQAVPPRAIDELLDAAHGRLSRSTSHGWALVYARHGTLAGERPDTIDIPMTHDWNMVYAVCHNCTGVLAGVSMHLHDPSGKDVSDGYATLPREVVFAFAESIGTYRAVISGGGCGSECTYTLGVFQERADRRGEVWDDRTGGG